MTPGQNQRSRVTLSRALPVWIRVAALSFGGPAGQIAVMYRLIVEERKWVGEQRFLHCMNYCMLLPGPEAQQLATYLGWLLHGIRGGLVAGALFILPGFLSILALSIIYSSYRDTAILEGVFYGLKPAVMAVVLHALLRIGRRALHRRAHFAIAAAAFVAIFFFEVPFPAIVAGSALLGYLGRKALAPDASIIRDTTEPGLESLGRPSVRGTLRTMVVWLLIWFAPVGVLMGVFGRDSVFVDEALFFSKAAVVTFGGAYAVLAYIAQQAVEFYHWLAPGEMLDGLGMAETTPGPLIQVVQFVGYMGALRNPGTLAPAAAGVLGSVVTAWVTFVPCFLFVFAGAPYAEYLRTRPSMRSAMAGITAAIVGVILNLAVWFSMHTIFPGVTELRIGPMRLLSPAWGGVDWGSLAIALGAALAMLRFRVGMLPTLGISAAVGLVLSAALH